MGYNMQYPFGLGDLRDGAICLANYMENAPSKIPWEDLQYIFGQIIWGGHIVNDNDRLLAMTVSSVCVWCVWCVWCVLVFCVAVVTHFVSFSVLLLLSTKFTTCKIHCWTTMNCFPFARAPTSRSVLRCPPPTNSTFDTLKTLCPPTPPWPLVFTPMLKSGTVHLPPTTCLKH